MCFHISVNHSNFSPLLKGVSRAPWILFFLPDSIYSFLTFSSLSNSRGIVESVPILGNLLLAEFGNETLWVMHLSLIWVLFPICYQGWAVSADWRESLKRNAIIRTCNSLLLLFPMQESLLFPILCVEHLRIYFTFLWVVLWSWFDWGDGRV